MTTTTTPYAVRDDVILALGRDISDTSDDAWITTLIPQAQAQIDEYLGFSLQQETGTRTYDGSDTPKLFVGELLSFSSVVLTVQPVIDVNFVYYLSQPSTTDITLDCVAGPTRAQPPFQLIRRSGEVFDAGVANVSVTGVFGYPTVPLLVQRACIRLAVHMLKMRDTNYSDIISDQGGITQRLLKRMPDDVMEDLAILKHRSFYSR